MADDASTPKDVFISYVRSERRQAERLAEAFRKFALTAWFDAALESGVDFNLEIEREVKSARAVMVCWSKRSLASRWVRSEAMIGADRRVLVPIFLEPCDPAPPFNLDHTEDLSDWRGEPDHEGWRNVLRRLGTLTGRGSALVDWASAISADTPKPYRNFLKTFPNDKLATVARQRIGALELEATRRRLEIELGIPLTQTDLNGEETHLLARAENAESRAEAAEAAVRSTKAKLRETQQRAEALDAELRLANSRREQAEAAVAAAERKGLDAEARARRLDEAGALANPAAAGRIERQDDIVRQPCPSCGNMINVAATLCGFCWHKLT